MSKFYNRAGTPVEMLGIYNGNTMTASGTASNYTFTTGTVGMTLYADANIYFNLDVLAVAAQPSHFLPANTLKDYSVVKINGNAASVLSVIRAGGTSANVWVSERV